MSSDRHPTRPVAAVRREDGRYLRYSFRYDTWQVRTRHGTWANIRIELARAYAASGFPIGAST
jgi:hypothetical protein